jgi:hypothetical protein
MPTLSDGQAPQEFDQRGVDRAWCFLLHPVAGTVFVRSSPGGDPAFILLG